MSDPVITIQHVAKRYRTGSITRRTFRDEMTYRWLQWTRRDPARHMGKLGAVANPEFWALKDVSFELRKGEVLGFAGLMGAGRTEVARAMTNDLTMEPKA